MIKSPENICEKKAFTVKLHLRLQRRRTHQVDLLTLWKIVRIFGFSLQKDGGSLGLGDFVWMYEKIEEHKIKLVPLLDFRTDEDLC